LLNDEQRPWGWTSADAAGLPIFPGLVRYDEAASGAIRHALRFTLPSSSKSYVSPASHWAPWGSAYPMGMRLRLKASFDISTYSKINQTILIALKQYGMILADNGTALFLGGDNDSRWDNHDLHYLVQLKPTDFEVVKMDKVYTAQPTGPPPVIQSLTAKLDAAGKTAQLNWSVIGASYLILLPGPGPVRGTTVTVSPAQTTQYTLVATGQYGRTTANVTVTVR
jgi:hypothetical protein